MAEESFILLSLKESKAKRLAQVISNETSRKILDHLAKKEGTESEIAKSLSVPISTIHYNLKQLVENRLVLADEFHYSEKGREVIHYKLAKKLIIIAPDDMDEGGIVNALKSVLPISGVVLAATAVIHYLTQSSLFGSVQKASAPLSDFAYEAAVDTVPTVAKQAAVDSGAKAAESVAADSISGMVAESATSSVSGAVESTADMAISTAADEVVTQAVPEVARVAAERVVEPVQQGLVMQQSIPQEVALWFLFGAVFALLVTAFVLWLRRLNRGK